MSLRWIKLCSAENIKDLRKQLAFSTDLIRFREIPYLESDYNEKKISFKFIGRNRVRKHFAANEFLFDVILFRWSNFFVGLSILRNILNWASSAKNISFKVFAIGCQKSTFSKFLEFYMCVECRHIYGSNKILR